MHMDKNEGYEENVKLSICFEYDFTGTFLAFYF